MVGREKVVVDLRCDGQPISGEDLDRVLDSQIDLYQCIEMQTRSVTSMVKVTLAQAIEAFEEAMAAREQIADCLNEGRTPEAMKKLKELFGIWKQVQQALPICAEALGVCLDDLSADGVSLPEALDAIRDQLAALKSAIEAGDYVLVGDIIRYELEEPLAQWLELMRELERRAV